MNLININIDGGMENSTMNIDECPIKNGGISSQLCLLEAVLSCYGSVLHS